MYYNNSTPVVLISEKTDFKELQTLLIIRKNFLSFNPYIPKNLRAIKTDRLFYNAEIIIAN